MTQPMALRDSAGRLFSYAKRHGFRATVRRFGVAFLRMLHGNSMVLFYCDLTAFEPVCLTQLDHSRIERKDAETELDAGDLLQIENVGNPKMVRRRLFERFSQGASLWLFKVDEKLAGYGWTLAGRTIESHFFPLASKDVHLFDFYVFPEYRGRRINRTLVAHILSVLAAEQKSRAFIEAAVWNTPQLHSLGRMPFQSLGCARKIRLFGRTLVLWDANAKRAKSDCRRAEYNHTQQ